MAESRVTGWTLTVESDGSESLAIDDGSASLTPLRMQTKSFIKQVASEGATQPNLNVSDDWNSIDSSTGGSSILTPTRSDFPNTIGSASAVPVGTDFTPWITYIGGDGSDAGYVTGSANLAVIYGGYDSINNQIAGVLSGYHCMLADSTNGHGAILSGSYHLHRGGRGVIAGGRQGVIDLDADFCFMGAPDDAYISPSSHRSVVITGHGGRVTSRDGLIGTGQDNTVSAPYAYVINGKNCTARGEGAAAGGDNVDGSGNNSFSHGRNLSTTGANTANFGEDNVAAGIGSVAGGRDITVGENFSQGFGDKVNNFYTGVLAQSGYAASLRSDIVNITFVGGVRTTTASTAKLFSSTGRHVFIPNNASMTGTCQLQAYDEDTGDTASWTIEFSGKQYHDVVAREYHNVTSQHDDITVGSVQMEFASWSGVRPSVVGAVKNLVWSARIDATVVLGPLNDTFTANATTNQITTTNSRTFAPHEIVQLTTTGTLPAGLSAGTNYYVKDPDQGGSVIYYGGYNFELSLTPNGTAIDITDTGAGTHTVTRQ